MESPLLYWYGDSDWEPNKKKLEQEFGNFKQVASRLNDGLDLEADSDRAILTPGKWVLLWRRVANDRVSKRENLSWVNLGPIVDKAFRYRGERRWRAAVLAAEVSPPERFNIKEARETNGKQNMGNARSNTYKGSLQTGVSEDRNGQIKWAAIKRSIIGSSIGRP